MKKISILTLIISFILVGAGCANNKGTSTGNPLVSLTMTSSSSVATVARTIYHKLFDLFVPMSVAKSPPAGMKDANNNDIVLTDFWISLGEIEFKYSEAAETGEVDGSEVEFAGPYAIDMFSSTPQTLASGNLVVSDFRRLKYKLNRVQSAPAGAPAGLVGNAIYLAGTVNGKPFTFTTQSEIEVTVAGANLVAAQASDVLLLQLQVANLVKKIDFSAVNSVSGTSINEGNRLSSASHLCPLIDSSLTDVYTCLMSGVSSEANLGRDLNGDGEFETSESTIK